MPFEMVRHEVLDDQRRALRALLDRQPSIHLVLEVKGPLPKREHHHLSLLFPKWSGTFSNEGYGAIIGSIRM
jgi:hypothetical protein